MARVSHCPAPSRTTSHTRRVGMTFIADLTIRPLTRRPATVGATSGSRRAERVWTRLHGVDSARLIGQRARTNEDCVGSALGIYGIRRLAGARRTAIRTAQRARHCRQRPTATDGLNSRGTPPPTDPELLLIHRSPPISPCHPRASSAVHRGAPAGTYRHECTHPDQASCATLIMRGVLPT